MQELNTLKETINEAFIGIKTDIDALISAEINNSLDDFDKDIDNIKAWAETNKDKALTIKDWLGLELPGLISYILVSCDIYWPKHVADLRLQLLTVEDILQLLNRKWKDEKFLAEVKQYLLQKAIRKLPLNTAYCVVDESPFTMEKLLKL